MEVILYGIGMFVLLIGVMIGYKLLKDKGIVGSRELKQSKLVLHVVKELVSKFEFDDKKLVKKIVSCAYMAVIAVEQSEKYTSNKEKYQLAEDKVYAFLNEMGIEYTEDRKEIIETSIHLIVSFLPPTYAKEQKKKMNQSEDFTDKLKGVIDNVK